MDGQAPAVAPAPDSGQGQAPDASAPTGPVGPSVTFQTFYDALAPYGNWIQTDTYGYVWQPTETDPNWAPYTDGRWVYSSDGWTWDSNEPFGWAVYHYGRWVNLDGIGWTWVPGYTWAPAWVSWRYGDGYVGWAPLPPDSFAGIDYFGDGYDPDYGFHIGGDADGFYGIGPILYVFLPIGCVGYHDYHHWYHNRNENFGLINRTTNVTNINVTRGHATDAARVTTGGPEVGQVDAASQDPVPRVSLARADRPGAGTLSGNTLSVFAPRVTAATGGVGLKPAFVSSSFNVAGINHGTDIGRPLAVNSHLAMAGATQEQIAAAHDAAGHAPASAKVLTDAASVRPVFSSPLTSLQPANVPPVEPATGARMFNVAPGTVFNRPGGNTVFGPVHMPSANVAVNPYASGGREVEPVAPQRIYNPTTVYTPHYSPGAVPTPGASPYVHVTPAPTYTPTATHVGPSVAPSAAPSGGGFSGGHSSGGGGAAAPGGSVSPGAGRSH